MQTGRNNPSTTRNGVQRSEVNTVMVIISNATSCQFALAQQLRQHSQKLREENTNSQPGGIRISVLGRAAGTMPHLEHTVLHTATVIYRSSVPRQSRGAAWRSSKKSPGHTRARAQRKGRTTRISSRPRRQPPEDLSPGAGGAWAHRAPCAGCRHLSTGLRRPSSRGSS